MYKVIIVDDECAVRERLLSQVSKLSNDFEVIGSYENGYDALLSGVPLGPDLIITDIKMPYIDGIELIRRAKLELPIVQSIIISGFDSFDFAKKAIELGVIGYITKPITFEELRDTLLKAKQELDKRNNATLDIAHLQEQANSATKVLQEQDLVTLITLKDTTSNFKNRLKSNGVDLDYNISLFGIFDFDEEIDNVGYEKIEYASLYIRKIFTEEAEGIIPVFHLFQTNGETSVFIESNEKIPLKTLQELFSRTLAKINRKTGVSLSCGLSEQGITSSPEFSYRKLYRHAKRALEYRTVIGTNIVITFEDIRENKKKTFKVDENDYKGISYELLYGKASDAKAKIEAMVNELSNEQYKDTYFFIINNIVNVILKSCISLPDLFTNYMPQIDIIRTILGAKSNAALLSYLCELVDHVIIINKESRIDGIESSFTRIKDYINNKYQISTLSLDDVANELSYSVSYISAILKKNNTSFTKYLTEVRMEHAISLLANNNEKMFSIAQKVGYEDPYYFSHCFKKYTGVAPLEYRKK
ncbi:MAG: response regulator [Bacilli bacterium]